MYCMPAPPPLPPCPGPEDAQCANDPSARWHRHATSTRHELPLNCLRRHALCSADCYVTMNTHQHCPTVLTCSVAPTSTLSHCTHLSCGTHVNTVPLYSLVLWHPRQHCPTVLTCPVAPTSTLSHCTHLSCDTHVNTVPLVVRHPCQHRPTVPLVLWHPRQHCPTVLTCPVAPTSTLSHCTHLSCGTHVNTVPLYSLVL